MSPFQLPSWLFPPRAVALVDFVYDWIEDHKLAVFGHLLLITTLTVWSLSTSPETLIKREERQLQQVGFGSMSSSPKTTTTTAATGTGTGKKGVEVKLDPPKDDAISLEELSKHDGTDSNLPVWVAIKGLVFDVSSKRDMYSPGAGYHIFAGKDGSRGLGMSSLKVEDAVSDYSTLDASELKVLDDWVAL